MLSYSSLWKVMCLVKLEEADSEKHKNEKLVENLSFTDNHGEL